MEKFKENFGLGVGVLLTAYAVTLGAIYMFGFSRPFGISFFPYLSLQDYIRFPLSSVVILMAPATLLICMFVTSFLETKKTSGIFLFFAAVICLISAGFDVWDAWGRFSGGELSFRNEGTVMFLVGLPLAVAVILIFSAGIEIYAEVLALILIQVASVLAAGYADGKGIVEGADTVQFLENTKLCEESTVYQWVYVAKFSEVTIFMNTHDKRLCFTDVKNQVLISRARSEARIGARK